MLSHVLVVDDEPFWREQFRDILMDMGFVVDTVEAKREAEDLLKIGQPALVLLDLVLVLPDLTIPSQQLITSIHRLYPDMPVIITTGYRLEPRVMWTFFQLGAVDFVYKPELDVLDFRRRVEIALSKPSFPPGSLPPSVSEALKWDIGAIHELLNAAFSEEEVTTICFNHFHLVYDNFGSGMSKGQKIRLLLEHCNKHNEHVSLLRLIDKLNPVQYAHFEERRRINLDDNKGSKKGADTSQFGVN